MARSAPPGEGRAWRRWTALVAGAAIVAVALSAAFIFAGSGSTRRVAESSRDLHWTNTAAASAATVRAALSQAIVFAVDRELGVATDTAAATTTDEAIGHTVALAARLVDPAAERPLGNPELKRSITATQQAADDVITKLKAQDVLGADAVFAERFEPAYRALVEQIAKTQQTLADEIVAAESVAGRVDSWTRLLVTLLIPVAAILIYRQFAKRELRRRSLAMEAKLEAERELGRAKDDFIAGISHELRTPLTSIYGFSEYLLDHDMNDEESSELIGLINRESADLSRMVEDLLTAARLDADAIAFFIEPVSVADEISDVIRTLQRSGSDIRILGHDQTALADRDRLHQILRNLISNAVKHGGPKVEVSVSATDSAVSISVSDDGSGVTGEMQERLFERFAHEGDTSLLVGSVGLGLAIGRTLAHGMGGDIVYEPDRDWTTFTLTLPRAPIDATVEPPAGRIHRQRDSHGITSEQQVLAVPDSSPPTAAHSSQPISSDHG